MPVKTVAGLRLGRLRPAARPRLKLGDYLDRAALPAPPAVIHWTYAADDKAGLFNILANGRLGDCTAAGAGHIVDLWRGNASGGAWVTEADAIAFYSASTGYVPGDPSTDRGGDEITVLDCWKSKGFFADGSAKISGYVAVDATNPKECKQAVWLFGNLYFGVELPNGWLRPPPRDNGFIWDVAGDPDPSNGHCFIAGAYNDYGAIVDTWGMIGTLTWSAVAKYAAPPSGELYAVLSGDWIDKASGKAPNGLDFAALQVDLASL